MLTLRNAGTADAIQGVTTAAATAITYTFFGDEVSGAGVDAFKVLAQGQLPTSVGALYSVPVTTQSIIRNMAFYNTTNASVNMTIYVTIAGASPVNANAIGNINIPAFGSVNYDANGWQVRDQNGGTISSIGTLTVSGDVSGTLSGTNIPTTLATFGPGATTVGDASHVAVVTPDTKGRINTLTSTPIAITSSAVSGLTFFATLANLSGDITTAGSGVTTLATVNGSPGAFGSAANTLIATVNAKGLITALSSTPIAIASGAVSGLTFFATLANLSGDATTSGSGVLTLATVNGSPGAFGSAASTLLATVNAKGLITSLSSTPIAITSGAVSGLTFFATLANLSGDVTTAGSGVTTIAAGAVTPAKMSNATANSLFGEFTGSAVAPQYQSVAVNQFIARASTGNLAPKTITDAALALDSSGATTGTFGSQSAFFPKEVNGNAYITAGNPQGWSGADLGAWVNAAYAYLVAQHGANMSGEIVIGPGAFNTATAAVVGTQFGAVGIRGAGAIIPTNGAALSSSNSGGTIWNYTATTGVALTIGGTNQNNTGARVTNIGFTGTTIGNGATAIQIANATTGSSAGMTFQSVAVAGFTNGVVWGTSPIAYAATFINCKIQYCTVGLIPNGEANNFVGGLIANNATGVQGSLAADFNALGTAFDDNTTTAINSSSALFRSTLTSCRWENAGGGTDNYVTQSAGSIIVMGGSMQSDGPAGTSTGFVQGTGGTFYLHGTWMLGQSSRVYTQLFNFSNAMVSVKADPVIPVTTAAGVTNTITAATPLFNITAGSWPRVLSSSPQSSGTGVVLPLTTVTNGDPRGGFPLPANVRPGTHLRATAWLINTATIQTLTPSVKLGTANSNADTSLTALPLTAGTAALSVGKMVVDVIILTATTAQASGNFYNYSLATTNLTGITAASVQSVQSTIAGPITIATTSPTFVGIYFGCTVANVITVRSVSWEVISN